MMRIGVPREIKDNEFRVGMRPDAVRELTARGVQVLIEKDAGEAIGLHDSMYVRAGGTIVGRAAEVFGEADLIVKVKEPQAVELPLLREGQTLFTYLHLAADPSLTQTLLETGVTGIAYETVTDEHERLPLLSPMSEVAGRMSIQAGAHCLEMEAGGRGQLLGGVPGGPAAKVTIVGGGVVGTNAARIAMGMEAHVTLIDISLLRLYDLDLQFGSKISTVYSTIAAIEEHVTTSDLVIGAVLVPGAAAPKLISEDMVKAMRKVAVIVDVAIDQGGCAETSRPTTHAQPTYKMHDVVHYCVTNMPGAVARTSTLALNNATLPFILRLAELGTEKALRADPHLRAGLNIYRGKLTHSAVAKAQSLAFETPEAALGMS